MDSHLVSVSLPLKSGQSMLIEANAVPRITGSARHEPIPPSDIEALRSLPEQDLAEPLASDSSAISVDMLIGADHYWELVCGLPSELPSGLRLVPTLLGLIATGKCNIPGVNDQPASTFFINTMVKDPGDLSFIASRSASQDDKSPDLTQFWDLETIGIVDPCDVSDDEKALEHYNSTVQFVDGRYQVGWPWKSSKADLPDNFALAVGRLRSIGQRLSKDAGLCQQYHDIIQTQLTKGIIEVAPDEPTGRLQHYLPHHPVVKESSSTSKIRIVYDASAKVKKTARSLNDCLYQGPNLLPNLRFRMGAVAMIADIEKAFLQLSIQPCDRDVTRFVWFKDHTQPTKIDGNLQKYRFCRVSVLLAVLFFLKHQFDFT